MGRNAASLNLLTLLLLTATAGVVIVVGLLFLYPGLAPGFLEAPTPVALMTPLATPPPANTSAFPTFPPEWTATPTSAATATATPDRFPTSTPVVGGSPSPLPDLNSTAAAGAEARVAPNADGLRLRALPGTAGRVVAFLPALTPVDVIGRTPDNLWIEIVAPGGERGWVMAEFLEIYINLVGVPEAAGAALYASPTPLEPDEARVALNANNLRLRLTPGTAGAIIVYLPAGMILDVIGRTEDNAWLQVITAEHQQGWVMTEFVEVFMDLSTVPVTGTAVDAPAPPDGSGSSGSSPPGGPVPIAQVTATPTPTPLPPTPTYTASPPPPTSTHTPPPPPPGGPAEAPFLSGVTSRARDIFLTGQSLGNQANVFAKVGDSITVAPQFLAPLGNGTHNLRDYGYLADALNHFASGWARTGNSFVNESLAAKGGWTTFSVLSPSLANTTLCRANESPLLCEYRLTRPAVALIMLGTNDVLGTTTDAYRANLRRIVEDTVRLGIIPVLSTIPMFMRNGYQARGDEINAIIIATAQEYEVPLWNYYAALYPLPNHGLSPDGVHPSAGPAPGDFTPESLQYGYTMRNLTALQALNVIWREVMQ